MSRITKFFVFLLFFIIFFEAGLFSSYTIVTSEPPNVEELVNFQLDKLAEFFSFNFNSVVIGEPDQYNVSNPAEVSEVITKSANVDGIDLETLKAYTYQSDSEEVVDVNITTMAFAPLNQSSKSTTISLSDNADFKIMGIAKGKITSRGIEIDPKTINITYISKVYSVENN